MKVITLNKVKFNNACSELYNMVEEEPDLMIGILNGGGHVVKCITSQLNNEKLNYAFIKLQRDNTVKKENKVIKFLFSIIPYLFLNYLRKIESVKSQKTLNNISLTELNKIKLDIGHDELLSINKILIVDDAIDTGKTMYIIKQNLSKLYKNADIKIAVISWTLQDSIIKPDVFLFKKVLVRFPWSRDYKGKDYNEKSISY